jgi:hypothetical protein
MTCSFRCGDLGSNQDLDFLNRQLSDDRNSNGQDSGDDDVVVQEIGSDEDDIDSDDDEGQIYEGDAGKKEEENISNLLQTTWSR